MCCSALQCVAVCDRSHELGLVRCSVSQCAAVCCSVVQYVTVHNNMIWAEIGVLQCVVVCCSALQCVTNHMS